MPSSFTPQLKKFLSDAGCYFERQGKGDHEIWYSPITQRRFVVDSFIKSRHTAKRMFEKWYSVIFITLLPPFPLVKGGNNKNPVPSPLQGEG
jgi:hypothetical protein